jgi:putrescine transport system substrate-binding protein
MSSNSKEHDVKQKIFAITASCFLTLSGAARAEGTLAIYTWADYLGAKTIETYQTETGTKVTVDLFDSNEILETKLLTGGSGYDVVFPAASNAERQAKAGAIAAIDPAKLKNYGNLNPALLDALDKVPGGRALGVPYTWGTIGVAWNKAKIKERLGTDAIDSLDVIFKPENAEKLKDCGVTLLDSPFEVIAVTLNYLGLDPYSSNPDDLAKAEETLKSIGSSIRYFHNQKPSNDLPAGDVCISLVYSGDAGLAQARAAENKNGVEIGYAVPKEGTMLWVDLMAIPADAPNPDEAYRFIDFMLKPEIAADVTNTVFFANANKAADQFVNPDILSDPGIYPPADVIAKLFADRSLDAKQTRDRTRLWTRIKTGL